VIPKSVAPILADVTAPDGYAVVLSLEERRANVLRFTRSRIVKALDTARADNDRATTHAARREAAGRVLALSTELRAIEREMRARGMR
jgi:hypothetical protein